MVMASRLCRSQFLDEINEVNLVVDEVKSPEAQ